MITVSARGPLVMVVLVVALVAASCNTADASDPKRTPVGTDTGSDREPATAPTIASGEILLEGLPAIEPTSPPSAGAGHYPLFSWEPVPAAEAYQVVVSGPAGPIWAWEGPDPRIRFGGLTDEPPADYGGPSLDGPGCWSVVALDADGHVIAASAVVPVTPGDEGPIACAPGT